MPNWPLKMSMSGSTTGSRIDLDAVPAHVPKSPRYSRKLVKNGARLVTGTILPAREVRVIFIATRDATVTGDLTKGGGLARGAAKVQAFVQVNVTGLCLVIHPRNPLLHNNSRIERLIMSPRRAGHLLVPNNP
ncbi:uncharacterized protein NECHADRAFT_88538 [Fusarium vanettenii 77-13-4]|uniref:Uncharacterized protein n=1 Tax=Fusarium vanettenii (strain ATCC MYA-4622 / CBS 123669 / FGSC 9596 / NRRL 45880 / 77-13-4) TaxID=660122 RepID=C7ZQX5_FUSV7|nr:uncharacterized protein NECHADRAFT_88538 [Fusarium vanettenii 77-13-4]EEU33588.1 predicted protein [Fusarium vanettenii 77-13-4]